MRPQLLRRFARASAVVATVASLGILGISPASAESNAEGEVAPAVSYTYNVGNRMAFSNGNICTGGYSIRGNSGVFTMTAGHCGSVGNTISGPAGTWARVSYKKPTTQGDSLLATAYSGVTQMQIIRDPRTGRVPAGTGRVTGVMPTSQQKTGTLVGKMGVTTGWTEGKIYGTTTWMGRTAICSTARTLPGDSGGPVWRSDGNGLRAVGMTVAYIKSTSNGCYLPMDQLLSEWGAWLPVFASRAGATEVNPTEVYEGLPKIDPSLLVPAVG